MHGYEASLAWRTAHQLALDIYRATERFPAHERYGLVNQMRCAAVAVSASITEACERAYGHERSAAVSAAARALAQVTYHLEISRELGYLSFEEMDMLQSAAEAVSRSLHELAAMPTQESHDALAAY